jgi:pimeloyl-ACP methyl ester carboxylesterase
MVNALSISSLAGKPSYPGPGTWLHGANQILSRRLQAAQRGANLFLTDFRVCDGYRGGLEAAARVSCPTTLVLGARDQMTAPKQTATLVEALKARIVTLPVGHSLMTEAPDALLAAVRGAVAPAASSAAR